MAQKRYSDEFKEQVIRECQETDNIAIVVRRYEMSANTIHTWIRKYREDIAFTDKNNAAASRNDMAEMLQIILYEGDPR